MPLTRKLHKVSQMDRMQTGFRQAGAKGFSLIELMVGILVGTIVIAAVTALYITTIRGAGFVTQEARLTQEARVSLDLMANDIRRAGYSHPDRIDVDEDDDTAVPDNPFMQPDRKIALHDDDTCLMLSYDPTYDYHPSDPIGSLDEIDRQHVFGYRLSGNVIEMLSDPSGQVSETTDCDAGTWVELTDPSTTNVTRLEFSLDASGCLSIDGDGEESRQDGACPENGDEGVFYFESQRVTIHLDAEHASAPQTRVSFSDTDEDIDRSLTVGVRNARIFSGIDE